MDPARLTTRSLAAGAALVVAAALAFALDGPMAQAAYQQGLDPAAFGFWRALSGAVVLGGFLATRPRSGVLAGIRRMRRAAVIRLALAALAGLGLNLALFQAFARLPVTVAVAAFGCYPLFVAGWEAASRQRPAGAVRLGLATVAVIGLVLLIRPNPSVSVPAAGLLLALLAAVLHAAYIVLSRDGWGEIGDGHAPGRQRRRRPAGAPPCPVPGPDRCLVRLDQRSRKRAETKVKPLAQDKQWFVGTLRRLGYTEAAEEAERELPDPVSTDELIKFADRFNISRDEVMSQMGGSP